MFILPIRTSIRPWRTPYVNYALIIVNAIIFLLQFHPDPITGDLAFQPWVARFMLTPNELHLFQFVSYAFLHGDFWHIFFNMFFLYLFGNNINDKLGHAGYLCLYLGGSVFAGVGHIILHTNPVLGASGAVAAVTGAYLVLFPRTLITVVYWLIFIGTIEVPALYFIAFKLILIDNIIARTPGSIAYDAHLAGYAFGIAAMLGMLATGLISSSYSDLWAMLKQWNRRRQYRDTISSGYDPFAGRTTTRQTRVKEIKKTAAERQQEEKIKQLRTEISSRMLERNLPAAAELYLELITVDSEQILPRQYLLDIANHLAGDNKHAESARAYEQFLTHYSNYEYVEQVQLMLGLLYSRYLNQAQLALKHLQAAAQKLTDPGQLKMCNDELEKLQN